jgi:hypothetical protein
MRVLALAAPSHYPRQRESATSLGVRPTGRLAFRLSGVQAERMPSRKMFLFGALCLIEAQLAHFRCYESEPNLCPEQFQTESPAVILGFRRLAFKKSRLVLWDKDQPEK